MTRIPSIVTALVFAACCAGSPVWADSSATESDQQPAAQHLEIDESVMQKEVGRYTLQLKKLSQEAEQNIKKIDAELKRQEAASESPAVSATPVSAPVSTEPSAT